MSLKFAQNNKLLNGIYDFYLPNYKCDTQICKGATVLCIKYCYGNCVFRHSKDQSKKKLSTELIAKENYRISQTNSFVEEMNELIKKTKDVKRIRIHSIGDFYDYQYLKKWISIITDNSDIQFTAYIKNFVVLEKYMEEKKKVPDNFNVLISIYPDTYDKYFNLGGKEYIEKLCDSLKKYYRAKIYIVCSRETFLEKIKNPDDNSYFCNGGTQMLIKKYNLEEKEYENLFISDQGCNECLKCYSNDKCPEGSKIYAVLRASSQLANIQNLLKKRENKDKFKILRTLYSDKQI